ncbi:hypothetical protein KY290_000900 [Solanum tuberosum]|uniref:Uncharacterized protein n=1 Tax=Solanum tuberosum TaxID=4113 RepID=A0ABQ7WKK7_SOLTU|nr:hypothetical protein KY290_000900 [Solanum tuberosum]
MSLIKMKYGVSTKMTHFHEQDYTWIRRGMLFPFLEHVDRLQGQTDLNDRTPADLRSAIEEAFLADNGVVEMLMVEINAVASNLAHLRSLPRGVFKACDSNQDQEFGFINKKLDIKQFETLHSCRDNGLALCGGTSLRQRCPREEGERRGEYYIARPADLRSAIEEAFLADNGVVEMLMVDIKQFETLHSCLALCGVPSLRQVIFKFHSV